jgi:hypothetical protein
MLKSAIVTAMLSLFGGSMALVVVTKEGKRADATPAAKAPAPAALPRPRAQLPAPGVGPAARDRVVSPDGPLPDDARQQLAVLVKRRIATQEEELTACIASLSEAIEKFNRTDYEAMDATIEAFQALTAKMRVLADEVIKGYGRFAAANEQLRRELRLAPDAYRQAAAYYRERANDYQDPVLRQNCLTLAENCENFIPVFQERLAHIDTFLGEVDRMQPFLRETAAWLKDFEDFLKLWPGGSTAEPRRQYREKLKLYAKAFAEFQSLFERFNEKLREATFSTRLQVERESRAIAARSRVTARRVLDLAAELSAETKAIDAQASVAWEERKRRKADCRARWQTRYHLLCCALVVESNRSAGIARADLPEGCHFAVISPDGQRRGIARTAQVFTPTAPDGVACLLEPVEGGFRENDLLVLADHGGRTGGDGLPAGGGV